MTDDSLIQHFAVWKAFNTKVYRKTLTSDHLTEESEKYIDKVFQITETSDGSYSVLAGRIVETKCMFLDKGGKKYILPSKYAKDLPLNPSQTFECYLKDSDKTIYTFIEIPKSVRITPTKTLSFKGLVTVFNPLQHSDAKTWEFLKIQAISAKAKGCKYRLCSVPATGKNCNSTILHCVTNDTVKVSKPTLAKLETLFYYNQMVIPDEITSLTASQVRDIEPFFLSIADESPTFTKHSLASKHDMNEVNISRSSCVFTYNDPKSLNKDSKFFDDVWQSREAFNNRYPALFLEGKILSQLPKLSHIQANAIMEENFDRLAEISKNLVYYFENMSKELHGWDRSKLRLPGRHMANFEGVIDGLDAYSDTQAEFDDWLFWVMSRIEAYHGLLLNDDASVPFVPVEEVV